jgi:hypothetical protein
MRHKSRKFLKNVELLSVDDARGCVACSSARPSLKRAGTPSRRNKSNALMMTVRVREEDE